MNHPIRRATLVLSLMACTRLAPTYGGESETLQQLERIHAAWFAAYDRGDGAAMDKIETDTLALGMPDGTFWYKKEPRAATSKAREAKFMRSLTDVVVREFGDTAILTGTLVSKEGGESDLTGTTVVFVRKAGFWRICSAQWTERPPQHKE
jgi:hypothetical protein